MHLDNDIQLLQRFTIPLLIDFLALSSSRDKIYVYDDDDINLYNGAFL